MPNSEEVGLMNSIKPPHWACYALISEAASERVPGIAGGLSWQPRGPHGPTIFLLASGWKGDGSSAASWRRCLMTEHILACSGMALRPLIKPALCSASRHGATPANVLS